MGADGLSVCVGLKVVVLEWRTLLYTQVMHCAMMAEGECCSSEVSEFLHDKSRGGGPVRDAQGLFKCSESGCRKGFRYRNGWT